MEEEIENQADSDTESNEEKYALDLRQNIAATQRQSEETEAPDQSADETGGGAEEENATANTITPLVWVTDAISDGLDFTGIGAIPILGDILDVAEGGLKILLLWQTRKDARVKVILAAVVAPVLTETVLAVIIPFLNDLLPSFIVGSLVGKMIINKAIKNVRQKYES